MNKSRITISEAIRIAVRFSRLDHDEPYCVSAIYEDDTIALVVFTLFQRYEFYVDACSGEVLGIMSEPAYFIDNIESALSA